MKLPLNHKVPCRYGQSAMGSSQSHRHIHSPYIIDQESDCPGLGWLPSPFILPLLTSNLPQNHLAQLASEKVCSEALTSGSFQGCAKKHLEILLWSHYLLSEFLTRIQIRQITLHIQKRHESPHLLEPRPIHFTDVLNDPFLLHRHFS